MSQTAEIAVSRPCRFCGKEIPSDRNPKRQYCNGGCYSEKRKSEWQSSRVNLACTADTGALSELLACADLMLAGFEVFRAVSPAASCDLIVIKSGRLLRVQVKTAARSPKTGTVSFPHPKRHDTYDIAAIVLVSERTVAYMKGPVVSGVSAETWTPADQ